MHAGSHLIQGGLLFYLGLNVLEPGNDKKARRCVLWSYDWHEPVLRELSLPAVCQLEPREDSKGVKNIDIA